MKGVKLLPIFLGLTGLLLVMKSSVIFAGWNDSMTTPAAFAQEPDGAAEATPDRQSEPAATDDAAAAAEAAKTARRPRDVDRLSRTEFELLQELRGRREALDRREDEIELQRTILDAKEKQIEKKISRLELLETSIRDLVDSYSQQEDERLKNLVQIYESMKAKDAADIFNRMELTTQIDLATRIMPRKMSAIISEMDPEKAKSLTVELAERDPLPTNLPEPAAGEQGA
ncbi:hypothetical protein CCR85_05370 [Rhodothalassium salexigens]|uniref:MotE family protein n=1 Tax=Rhodothalassium salexigens TaxID=1086 RepID=UPI001911913E|nr:hypothetical protein [Rhodothalassium salexigens]MBK5910923.1 hypothetical protein [Rhodothalassium salexigens]MBK5919497.1 hypothetical protein [Rhodothalassium salexigens]